MLKQVNKYTLMHKNITVADLELDRATGVILADKKNLYSGTFTCWYNTEGISR